MALKPEMSVAAGLATATLVYSIYNRGLPSAADIRTLEQHNADVDAIRKQNTWIAAGVVGAISLISKDPTIFVVGGAMVIALDWSTRHADAVNPITGHVDRLVRRSGQEEPTQAADDGAYGPDAFAA